MARSLSSDLPYVDTQRTTVSAPRAEVWAALRRYAASVGVGAKGPLTRLLGADPPTGFRVVHEVPQQEVGLAGRHRFSRYLLVFELADAPGGGTVLSAHTYAAFPGPHGRVYRALVVGTGAHEVATRRMLRSVGEQSVG